MPFDWDQYLVFANDLKDNSAIQNVTCSRETLDRCIVSRAYYAAFHFAKKYAEDQSGEPFDREGIHEKVRLWFRENRSGSSIPQDLRDFSRKRNQCDYDDDVDDLEGLIIDSIKCARRIKHILHSYRSN